MIIIPEEAEHLLQLVRGLTSPPTTHVLVYAAPVTRKMLHFNDLKYYAVPSLPSHWSAPSWLQIELGVYAGRLYFEYSEYSDLLSFLGVREQTGKLEEEDDGEGIDGSEEHFPEAPAELQQEIKVFTKKPLTFMQEWLALHRKGQKFDESPMVS